MPANELTCHRCHLPVIRNAENYETFEHMHWSCFHYEFEHTLGAEPLDPDIACRDPGCPARAFDTDAVPDWDSED